MNLRIEKCIISIPVELLWQWHLLYPLVLWRLLRVFRLVPLWRRWCIHCLWWVVELVSLVYLRLILTLLLRSPYLFHYVGWMITPLVFFLKMAISFTSTFILISVRRALAAC